MLAGYGMRVPRSETAGQAAGYVFLSAVVGLAAVFYYAYASFFVLEKTCLLCVAIYVAVVGIFFVSSAAAPSGIGVLKDVGRDLSGVLANPAALGLGAAWLVASLALVGLFPREPIGDAAAPAQAAAVPLETLDPAALTEWHRWLDAQPKKAEALPGSGVKVLVLKFNDYQCPACRMTYMAYRDIIAKYQASHPDAFRYETRDFPLETECGFGGIHGSACEAAVAVRLARAKNKDKELEAWLFDRQEGDEPRSREAGAAADRAGVQLRRRVREDPRAGARRRAPGTAARREGHPDVLPERDRGGKPAPGVFRRRDRLSAEQVLNGR